MNADRLEQIDRIFQSALDLLPAEREEFLQAQCANDSQLRAEVESLISAHVSFLSDDLLLLNVIQRLKSLVISATKEVHLLSGIVACSRGCRD